MKMKGFTLIELIVVIAIIAILAAIVAPNAFKAVEKAKISGAVEDYRSIKTAAMAYYADVGSWPVNCTGSACSAHPLINDTTASPILGWDGPYLEKWPQQAKWGGNYSWRTETGSTFGTSNAGERYVIITNVPRAAALKIDQQLDGSNNTTSGAVQYTAADTVAALNILVSRDGPID